LTSWSLARRLTAADATKTGTTQTGKTRGL